MITHLGQVQFEHIPRAENVEADRLANMAMDGSNQDFASGSGMATPSFDADPSRSRNGGVLAVGIDFESISRVENLLTRYGERFLQRIFTDDEISFSQKRRRTAQHLTGRFSAKEATMKALGTGRALGVLWRNIEVIRSKGAPELRLHGQAAQRCQQLGASRSLLSISYSGDFALAQVLLLKS